MFYLYIEFLNGEKETYDFNEDIIGAMRLQTKLLKDKQFMKNVREMRIGGLV